MRHVGGGDVVVHFLAVPINQLLASHGMLAHASPRETKQWSLREIEMELLLVELLVP